MPSLGRAEAVQVTRTVLHGQGAALVHHLKLPVVGELLVGDDHVISPCCIFIAASQPSVLEKTSATLCVILSGAKNPPRYDGILRRDAPQNDRFLFGRFFKYQRRDGWCTYLPPSLREVARPISREAVTEGVLPQSPVCALVPAPSEREPLTPPFEGGKGLAPPLWGSCQRRLRR